MVTSMPHYDHAVKGHYICKYRMLQCYCNLYFESDFLLSTELNFN